MVSISEATPVKKKGSKPRKAYSITTWEGIQRLQRQIDALAKGLDLHAKALQQIIGAMVPAAPAPGELVIASKLPESRQAASLGEKANGPG